MKRNASTSIASLLLLLAGCADPEEAPARRSAFADAAPMDRRESPSGAAIRFTDVTAASGIAFSHDNGAFGRKYLPETMGSGVAVLDADGDGAPDLFFVNSGRCDGDPRHRPSPSAFWRNRGDGTFTDESAWAGLDLAVVGMGAVAADYDGDGDPDLLVTTIRGNLLFRNDGGRFRDATAEAGVGGGTWRDGRGGEHGEWSTGAVFLDGDGDGDLDLFVANYVRWSPATDVFTTLDGRRKAYTTPTVYPGLPPRYFENRGDGTFADASHRLTPAPAADPKALGVVVTDANLDGLPDLFVSNDTQPNQLFLNRGDGTFADSALEAGVAFDETGGTRAGMGVGEVFLPGGATALAVGNFSREPVSLYTRFPAGLYVDRSAPAGLGAPTLPTLTFGLLCADFDLDGYPDLLLANGHIEPTIGEVQREISWAQPPQLFLGTERGRFRDVSRQAGEDFARPRVARGAAWADFDGDGDLDVILTRNGGAPALLRNDGAEGRSFVRVRLRGAGADRDGTGAVVTVRSGDLLASARVGGGGSYLSSSELPLTFGLCDRDRVDLLRVVWRDGTVEEHRDLPARRRYIVTRGGRAEAE